MTSPRPRSLSTGVPVELQQNAETQARPQRALRAVTKEDCRPAPRCNRKLQGALSRKMT